MFSLHPAIAFVAFTYVSCQNIVTDRRCNLLNGNCFTKIRCSFQGGLTSGFCGNGFTVCCIFYKSCGTIASVNNTFFINPSYPLTYAGGDQCIISIRKLNYNICQLRLNFLELNLAHPSSEGICDLDIVSINGGAYQLPRICGEINDQHVYVDFEGVNPIKLSIFTSSEYAMKRRWNIQILQIACNSPLRAPSNCLQYYTSTSGTVTSFNYGISNNPRLSTGTREIANLNYGICIKSVSGYCSIKWSATDDNSFSISGDASGTPTSASGVSCTTDYIIIPNPTEIDSTIKTGYTERFCGTSFTTKTTSTKPYVLYVITDNTETTSTTPDKENKGFSLMYKQSICLE